MASFTVGCVPFVNARPLVAWFDALGAGSPVEVVYDVPSRLPKMLDDGKADAVLASSYDALRTPGRRIADGVCIGSFGRAESVKLLSKVPFNDITSLALDSSSLTSNYLAQVVLSEVYGTTPDTAVEEPVLDAMLRDRDAAVLIGDIGMAADGEGLHVLDLGEAWTKMTGLPFVWAVWIGNDRLTIDLATLLAQAERWSNDHIQEVIDDAAASAGWDRNTCARYLTRTMLYPMGERELDGLRAFREALLRCGFVEAAHFPTVQPLNGAGSDVPKGEEAHQL